MQKKTQIFTLLLSLFAETASAELITEVWQAEVINTTHTAAAAIGDILNWSVTYDDESRYMHQYSDGADGVASTADDLLNITWDVQAPAYAVDWNVFSDAVWDFGNIFTKMEQVVIDSALSFRDAYSINENLFYGADDKNRYEHVADHRDLFLIDNFDPLINDTARFNVYYWYINGSPESVRVDVGNFSKTTVSAPEPASMMLIILGLVTLFVTQFRRSCPCLIKKSVY